jgi:predicted  nucleic acid-binding Zn-ribbon protein
MMSDAIVALVNEVQDKDEQIDRLTAERDSFKACYDISFKEANRIRTIYDKLKAEYAKIQADLYVSQAALRKVNYHSNSALDKLESKPVVEETMPRAVIFNR